MATELPTRLILIRHAESVGNAENIVQGWTDSPLSERGLAQASYLGMWLKEHNLQADYLFASPLRRAYQTAEAVGAALDLKVELREGLKEVFLGQLEDTPDPVFTAAMLNSDDFEIEYGAETTPVFAERALGTLHGLLARYHGKTLIVVTHLGVICTALAFWLERDVWQGWNTYGNIRNTGVTELVFHFTEAVEVVRQGDLQHL